MEKEAFLQHLKDGSADSEIQLQCCQYFVDNYPVQIDVKHPFFGTVVGKTLTSLQGYQVKNDKKAMDKLEENYNKLVARIKEIEEYGKE